MMAATITDANLTPKLLCTFSKSFLLMIVGFGGGKKADDDAPAKKGNQSR